LFETAYEARRYSAYGLTRLAVLTLHKVVKRLASVAAPPPGVRMVLPALGIEAGVLQDRILRRGIAEACGFLGEQIPRDADRFMEAVYAGKPNFYSRVGEISARVGRLIEQAGAILAQAADLDGAGREVSIADIRGQIRGLFYEDFVLWVPGQYLSQYPRYLLAMERRLERLRLSAAKDMPRCEEMAPYFERLAALTDDERRRMDQDALDVYRWMLEEWRVSLFAQELGTLHPVSAKRLDRQWAKAVDSK
jgi:ATP-dependent helicase HrpA